MYNAQNDGNLEGEEKVVVICSGQAGRRKNEDRRTQKIQQNSERRATEKNSDRRTGVIQSEPDLNYQDRLTNKIKGLGNFRVISVVNTKELIQLINDKTIMKVDYIICASHLAQSPDHGNESYGWQEVIGNQERREVWSNCDSMNMLLSLFSQELGSERFRKFAHARIQFLLSRPVMNLRLATGNMEIVTDVNNFSDVDGIFGRISSFIGK